MTEPDDTEHDDTGRDRDDSPSVTAVVGATHCSRIRATLSALDRQLAPRGSWRATVHLLEGDRELTALVKEWVALDPASRSVERSVGAELSVARWAEVHRADTDVVAFLAEGAVVSPTWVLGHARMFERPEVAAATGSVGLCWLVGRPEWWTPEHDRWFGVVEVGDEALALGAAGRLSPHNASLRTVAIEHLSSQTRIFDDGSSSAPGGPSLVDALRRHGWHAVRVPDAPVIRQIRADDIATMTMLRLGWAAGRRSLQPAEAVSGSGARLRRASAEALAASRVVGRLRHVPSAARLGAAIAGCKHLGRASSFVAGVGKGLDRRAR